MQQMAGAAATISKSAPQQVKIHVPEIVIDIISNDANIVVASLLLHPSIISGYVCQSQEHVA